jgi:hypothetical protein
MRQLSAALLLLTAFPAWSCADFVPVGVGSPSHLFDLATDWSDTNNPNGGWRYSQAIGRLPLMFV